MEKKIIEGFNGFQDALNEFTTTCKKDEQLIVRFTNFSVSQDARALNCSLDNLVDTIFCKDISEYIRNQDDLLEVENEVAILQFAGANFLWWNENARRRNKLKVSFEETPVQEKTSTKQPAYDKDAKYSVAVGDLDENGLSHIDFFQGTKAECLQWLNKMIVRHTDLKERTILVFNLHFEKEDMEYETHIDKWKTLEELIDEDKVTI